jgi:hypothetical protein
MLTIDAPSVLAKAAEYQQKVAHSLQ